MSESLNNILNLIKSEKNIIGIDYISNYITMLFLQQKIDKLFLDIQAIAGDMEYLNTTAYGVIDTKNEIAVNKIIQKAILIAYEVIQIASVCSISLEERGVKLNVGVIFYKPKKNRLMSALKAGGNKDYNNIEYYLNPIEIPLIKNFIEMIHSIADSGVDVIIIDYELSATYTEISLAKIWSYLYPKIPIFFLTLHPKKHEKENDYKILDFKSYIENPFEINTEIIDTVIANYPKHKCIKFPPTL